MTCSQFEHRLHELEDYLDGRLDAAQRSEVEIHLAACELCRAAVEDAPLAGRLLRAGLSPAAESLVGEAFITRVRAGLREAQSAAAMDFWPSLEALARRFAWTAVAAVVLLSAYVVGIEAGFVPRHTRQAEVRELFPDPEPQPANPEEMFLVLASSGNGR